MAANYLHGVETIEVERGPRPVRTVKSAVIGLIGTAPIGTVNGPVLCLSEKDAAAFGSQLPGFTIPQALDAIYDHGAGTVVVINVLDPATHKTAVASEAVTFSAANDRVLLAHGAVASVVPAIPAMNTVLLPKRSASGFEQQIPIIWMRLPSTMKKLRATPEAFEPSGRTSSPS